MKDGDVQAYTRDITLIAKSAGIVFGGTMIGTGLKYLFEALVARHLGPELFGLFFLGLTVFSVLGTVSTLGLHNGVLRYVSLFRGVGDRARVKGTILLSLRVVFIVATVFSLLTIIFSRTIGSHLFHEEQLAPVLRIFSLGIVFSTLTEILVFSIQASQIVKYRVLVRMVFEPGSRLVFVIPVFLLGWKLLGVLAAFLLSLVLGTVLGFSYLKKVFPVIQDQTRPVYETKKILSFSWPLFFVGFLDLLIVQISTLMLGHFKTSQEVGIYGAAQRTAFLIPVVLTSFNAIFAPMIADYYHRKEQKMLERLFKIVTKWIFTISFPLFLILALFAEDILRVWGEQYKTGAVCLIIICCAQLINCAVGSVGFVIMMTGRTILNFINDFVVFLMILILNCLLIPRYGILGAAASLAIALSSVNIVRLIEVWLILKIHPYRKDYYKPLLAGGSAVVAAGALNRFLMPNLEGSWPALIVNAGLIMLAYGVVLLFFGLDEEEKIIWHRIRAKFFDRGA